MLRLHISHKIGGASLDWKQRKEIKMKKVILSLLILSLFITSTSTAFANEASSGSTSETATSDNADFSVEPQNDGSEAQKVYEEFYNAVKFTENNKEWDNAVFIQYKLFESDYIEWFEKYVKGGTKEIFHPMSLFDKFIWSESYLRFAWAVNVGKFDTYYGNEKNFETHITSNVVNIMKNAKDSEKAVKAYLKLAKWQYEYVRQNGGPFNFINNKTYFEEIGEEDEDGESIVDDSTSNVSEVPEESTTSETSEVLDSKGLSKEDKEELAQAAKELREDSSSKTEEAKSMSGSEKATGMNMTNIIMLLVIVCLLGVVGVLLVKKKKSN